MHTHIRWQIRRDTERILTFGGLYSEADEMLACLRQRNCIGAVAECGDLVVGHMIYFLECNHLRLHTVSVHPEWRRLGVGRKLLAKLVSKIPVPGRRHYIVVDVGEDNLAAHQWLKACGWEAVNVLRGGREERDLYRFIRWATPPAYQPAGNVTHELGGEG